MKDRRRVSLKTVCGEVAAVNDDSIEDWKNSILIEILSGFDELNLFNLDETGLFYHVFSNKTLSFTDEKCTTGKAYKQYLRLLVGAYMSGNEKLNLYEEKPFFL